MAPSFLNLKQLRRRSRASFRTDPSTDNSSNDDQLSHGTAPTTGSLTPPSLAAQSDLALHLQVKDRDQVPPIPQLRPPLQTASNKRYSVGGMTGLGSPNGQNKPIAVSHYAPRITNVTENSWVWILFPPALFPPPPSPPSPLSCSSQQHAKAASGLG
jgi:hypothetical protein